MDLERLFGRPARRVLADCKRAMEANRKTSSDGSENASDEFEPEAKSREDEASQTSGIRRGADGLEMECGQVGFQISCRDALEGKAAIAIACPPPSGDTIDGSSRCRANNVRWIDFRRGRSVPTPVANAPTGKVLVFPVGAAQACRRMEW